MPACCLNSDPMVDIGRIFLPARGKFPLGWIVLLWMLADFSPTAAQSIEGFSEPVRQVNVASPELTTIEKVLVRQGQCVKEGDPLVRMDQELLLPALELARARAESRAKLDAAKIELQVKERRIENLNRLGRENSSSEEIIRAQADVELASTQVLAAEEEIRQNVLQVRQIEVQLARRTIRSPINGCVTRIHYHEGELVTASRPELVTVADLSRLRIVFHPTAPEADTLLQSGSVSIRLERGNENEFVEASVDFVSPVTNADSGTVRVELLLDNSLSRYRSGGRCWLAGPMLDSVKLRGEPSVLLPPRPPAGSGERF